MESNFEDRILHLLGQNLNPPNDIIRPQIFLDNLTFCKKTVAIFILSLDELLRHLLVQNGARVVDCYVETVENEIENEVLV